MESNMGKKVWQGKESVMDIPDPSELMESRIERMMDEYVEGECMECHEKVNHELICMSPIGDSPAICEKCAGYPFGEPE